MNLLLHGATVVFVFSAVEDVASLQVQRTLGSQEQGQKVDVHIHQKRAGVPNVVLIVADQHRSDWTNFDIPGLQTPIFNTVSASGVRFSRATVPSPLCAPSRASLATGRRYGRAGVEWNFEDVPPDTLTVYKLLQENGVYTMTVGKDDLTMASCPGADGSYHAAELGFDSWVRCGGKLQSTGKCRLKESYSSWLSINHPTVLQDLDAPAITKACNGKIIDGKQIPGEYLCSDVNIPQEAYVDNFVADSAVSLINKAPEDSPFFLQVNYAGPHPPTQVTKGMVEMFDADRNGTWELPLAVEAATLPLEEQETIRHRYAMEIENIDRQNAKILGALQYKKIENNTVVCITSDHGEQLGDFWDNAPHGDAWGKKVPWQGSVNVPLACAGPGIATGLVVDTPVSTLDLTATILELMNTVGERLNMNSKSLVPYLTGASPKGSAVTSGLADSDKLRMSTVTMPLSGGFWKLMVCLGSCPYGESKTSKADMPWAMKLFNLDKDPLEQHDLLTTGISPYVSLALQMADHLEYPANVSEVRAALLILHRSKIVS